MRRAIALALLLVLAGCGGQTAPTPTPAPTPASTPAPTPTATATPTPTATPSPTATPTPTPAMPDNPWGAQEIAVAVDDALASEDIEPQVRTALHYWEANANATQYRDINFTLIEDQDRANLVIRVEETVDSCGLEFDEEGVGCAPFPGDGGFDDQAVVRIERGYTADSRRTIIEHELGHTLGLSHSAAVDVMDAELSLTELPQPDAADTENPWKQPTVRIHVDYSGAPQPIREDHREQVSRAIEYYQDGAEGFTPENVTVTQVDSASEADITVEFADRTEIGHTGEAANGTVRGLDPDGDGHLETFTNASIRLAYDVEGEYRITAYNLGHWLAYSFAAPDKGYPPPWAREDITYRDEWWERA